VLAPMTEPRSGPLDSIMMAITGVSMLCIMVHNILTCVAYQNTYDAINYDMVFKWWKHTSRW
jgi:succinate dehydrogenase hydrophobic anchor subunit